MLKGVLTRLLLAIALLATISGAAAAQDEPAALEGQDWHLVAYAVDGGIEAVPWTIEATLLLEGGSASGSAGCNTFNGSYTLAEEQLTFDPAIATTRMACPGPASTVESAYMSLLPQTATWAIADGVLSLFDAAGAGLLEFELAALALTQRHLASIDALLTDQQAELDRAHQRLDNMRVGTLRDRIKTLEAAVQTLKAQAASASASSSNSGSGSSYNATEKVLLKAIPNKVRTTCRPLRSSLPRGTVAAVACDGVRSAVAEMAYYLMEWQDAEATLKSVAAANGVPNRQPRCHNQKAGWVTYGAPGGAEACWADNGIANFRLITTAAGCHQLDVAGTKLTEPAVYLAIEGKNNRMEPLRAAGLAYTDATYYIMNFEVGGSIPHGNQPLTPACRNT
jgi:heat shock protein HslJ